MKGFMTAEDFYKKLLQGEPRTVFSDGYFDLVGTQPLLLRLNLLAGWQLVCLP